MPSHDVRPNLSRARALVMHCGIHAHSLLPVSYKRAYRPSQLLCPVHRVWVPLDEVVHRLDKDKHAALADVTPEEAAALQADEEADVNAAMPHALVTAGRQYHVYVPRLVVPRLCV